MAFERYCKSSELFRYEALQVIEDLPINDKEVIKGNLGFETDLDITYLVNNGFVSLEAFCGLWISAKVA